LQSYRYDPIVTGLFTGIGGLVLWYFLGMAVEEKIVPKSIELIAAGAAAAFGAYIGAFMAFKYNSALNRKKLEIEKIETFYLKFHQYSRTAKMYLWSIGREGDDIVVDRQLAVEAGELLYECEVYKLLYFSDLPLEPSIQHAELLRVGGYCERHWNRLPKGVDLKTQDTLDVHKLCGNEVIKLDKLLKPVFDWCKNRINNIH